MGKGADPADISVLFFPAGARATRNMMQVPVLSALATGASRIGKCHNLRFLSRIGKFCHLRCFVVNRKNAVIYAFLVLIFWGPNLYLCYSTRFFHLWFFLMQLRLWFIKNQDVEIERILFHRRRSALAICGKYADQITMHKIFTRGKF